MGKRGKNPLFKPHPNRTTCVPEVSLCQILHPRLPQLPPVRKVESYPLADFLYDRSRAAHDLALANLRWRRFKETLTEYERDQVERVERLFAKRVQR